MIVCRPHASQSHPTPVRHEGDHRAGGPVFLPRRRPTVLAETLLAELESSADDPVTPYDEDWFAGRPSV